jgi:membrane-associated phospholipid phosphatase
MKFDVLEKFLILIPYDYIVRFMCTVTMCSFFGAICAQAFDASFTIRQTSTTLSTARRAENIVLPVLMVTYGAVSLDNRMLKIWDNQIKTELYDRRRYRTRLDNYLQFAPSAAAFGMKIAGVKSVHKLQDMVIIYALANLLETGIIYPLKIVSKRMRPDRASNNSFPSGHTATAFVAAEFLNQEYGYKSVWISVGGYTVATLVGAGRIFNNRHWFSDVLAGAGIGVFSVKMVYWTYPSLQKMFRKERHKKLRLFAYPSYRSNAFCLNVTCNF